MAQDVKAGEMVFTLCEPCHAVGNDAKNKAGPTLNGLDGRKAGTVRNFGYSSANKNSKITWNEATFKEYVRNPLTMMPGTLMMLSVKNENEIADLWAYLKQFKADGSMK